MTYIGTKAAAAAIARKCRSRCCVSHALELGEGSLLSFAALVREIAARSFEVIAVNDLFDALIACQALALPMTQFAARLRC